MSPESKGWNFLTLEGEQSMQIFWTTTCRELYRRTSLTVSQAQEMTDEEIEDTMWEATRPWEEQWESLQANESKVEGQVIDEDDRQTRFWRHRPDGFAVNEKEHVIYVLEFKRVTDNGEKYVSETHRVFVLERIERFCRDLVDWKGLAWGGPLPSWRMP